MVTQRVSDSEICNLVSLTLKTLKAEHLADSLLVVWNKRMTRAAGYARCKITYQKDAFGKIISFKATELRIDLSVPLWNRQSKIKQTELIVHEVCHIVAYVLYGPKTGHGPKWKQLMRQCGYGNPERCHQIDTSDLKRKHRRQPRVQMKCSCPGGISVGPTVAKRIIEKNKIYRCRRCRNIVKK